MSMILPRVIGLFGLLWTGMAIAEALSPCASFPIPGVDELTYFDEERLEKEVKPDEEYGFEIKRTNHIICSYIGKVERDYSFSISRSRIDSVKGLTIIELFKAINVLHMIELGGVHKQSGSNGDLTLYANEEYRHKFVSDGLTRIWIEQTGSKGSRRGN